MGEKRAREKETRVSPSRAPVLSCAHLLPSACYTGYSLTSMVVKSLERLIHNHIMSFLSDNKLLCDNQHGFRPLRSQCTTQLLQLVPEWLSILD